MTKTIPYEIAYVAFKEKYVYPATNNVYWKQILEGPIRKTLAYTRVAELKTIKKNIKDIIILEKSV